MIKIKFLTLIFVNNLHIGKNTINLIYLQCMCPLSEPHTLCTLHFVMYSIFIHEKTRKISMWYFANDRSPCVKCRMRWDLIIKEKSPKRDPLSLIWKATQWNKDKKTALSNGHKEINYWFLTRSSIGLIYSYVATSIRICQIKSTFWGSI